MAAAHVLDERLQVLQPEICTKEGKAQTDRGASVRTRAKTRQRVLAAPYLGTIHYGEGADASQHQILQGLRPCRPAVEQCNAARLQAALAICAPDAQLPVIALDLVILSRVAGCTTHGQSIRLSRRLRGLQLLRAGWNAREQCLEKAGKRVTMGVACPGVQCRYAAGLAYIHIAQHMCAKAAPYADATEVFAPSPRLHFVLFDRRFRSAMQGSYDGMGLSVAKR